MNKEIFNLLKYEINQGGVGSVIVRKYLLNKAREKGIIRKEDEKGTGTYYNMTNALFKMTEKGVLIKNTPGTYLVVRMIPHGDDWKATVRRIKDEKNIVSAMVVENPLDEQVGGIHYSEMVVQPIELIVKLRLSFIQGNIVKYICRYERKNGIEDVEKCKHYSHLAIELGEKANWTAKHSLLVDDFCKKNKLNLFQKEVLDAVIKGHWRKIFELSHTFIKKSLDGK